MSGAKKDIYILGIHTGHNATAALLKNGEIIACVSEERFTGVKNQMGLPKQSIAWCLEYAHIKTENLDFVTLPSLFGSPVGLSEGTKESPTVFMLNIIYELISSIRTLWGRLVYRCPKLRPIGTFFYWVASKTYGAYLLKKEKQFIASYLHVPVDKITTTGHHLSHASASYYSSPFNQEKAIVLTLDAEGDDVCSTVSVFHKGKIQRLASTSRENSLGWIYRDVTIFLGMKGDEHEYKVMGLAPYAKEKDVDVLYNKIIKNILTLDPNNKYRFYAKFNTQDTLYVLKRKLTGVRFDILAGAFQKLIEERLVEWVTYVTKQTRIHTITCAGGVFMNVKANYKISHLPSVSKAFFMPSAGDESLVIGSCYLTYLKATKSKKGYPYVKPLQDLYLGPSYSDKEILIRLSDTQMKKKYIITKPNNIERQIAQLLAKGNVVARCSGRMEWGARALGNRSILANPQNTDIVKYINDQMKQRDFWMPFAPAILWERAHDYCIIPKHIEAPYMIICFDSTELGKKELRAAMHPYDFTLRPQLIKESWNPSYYKIIKEFEHTTGIGGVLNTSFNLHGFPIVLGPKEALYAFDHSGLQYLALGSYLIHKKVN
ncbi:MAG: Carbamoyl transferase [Microgenomates group bacterium GW2011_GWC1_39_12]|nr:MAG: Carbamoyl transferase [Microgenomates group bacterium GW2011_GWC1_39_12]